MSNKFSKTLFEHYLIAHYEEYLPQIIDTRTNKFKPDDQLLKVAETILDDMMKKGFFWIPAVYCDDIDDVQDDEQAEYFYDLEQRYNFPKIMKDFVSNL